MNKWILNAGLLLMFGAGVAGGYAKGYQSGYKEGMTLVAGNEETLRQIGLYACSIELEQAARENPGASSLNLEGGRCNQIMKALDLKRARMEIRHE